MLEQNHVPGNLLAKEQAQKFFNLTLELLCVAGFDGYFKILNPSWEKLLGFSNEELKSQPFIEFVHPDDRESTINEAAKLAKGNHTTVSFENRYRCKDKTYKWLRWTSTTSTPEGLIYATAHDISAEKTLMLQQDLINQLLQLNLTTLNLNEILQQALELIIKSKTLPLDSQGGIFLTNPDQKSMNLAVQTNMALPLLSLCENILFGQCLCGQAALTKRIQFANCIDQRHEIRFAGMKAHGHYNIPILDDDKNVLGVIVLYLFKGHKKSADDIQFLTLVSQTIARIIERKYTEKKIIQSRQEAEQASRTKSEFLANMSHELRTPLNAIIGYSELLQEEYEDIEDTEMLISDLSKIKNSGQHLLTLINDILDLSKIEAGKMELIPTAIDIEILFRQLKYTVEPLINKNHNTLNLMIEKDIKPFVTDEQKLKQILLNLLSNAAKFTNNGQITLSVTSHINDSHLYLHFKVNDTGIGISKKNRDKLFKSFSQLDASTTRKYGGTGLGLALCREMCALLKGSIYVESELKKGTTFEVKLPSLIITKDQNISLASNKELPTEILPFNQPKILVVDDDPHVLNMMYRILSNNGYTVKTASSGKEALKIAEQNQFSLITLDIMMPEMDGWEILRKLKDNQKTANIPVMMLSMAGDRETAYALGATEFISKPIEKTRLLPLINSISHSQTNGKHILVVDDDEATREMLKRVLERENYLVKEAVNGLEALSMIEQEMPLLILLDIMMPELDGFDVIKQLQSSETYKDIPIIVLTAKDISKTERQKLNGYIETVSKKGSYTHKQLLQDIDRILDINIL